MLQVLPALPFRHSRRRRVTSAAVRFPQSLEPRCLLAAAPLAHWKLDETWGVLLDDAAAAGADGTRFGAAPGIGIDGGALQFDGLDDRLEFGTQAAVAGQSDFTVSAWVRTTATARGVIIQQRDATAQNGQYWLRMEADGSLAFSIFGDNETQFLLGTSQTINDGAWHHVVAGREGKRGFIWIDGVQVAETYGLVKNLNASLRVAVGADIREGTSHFNGLLDDVRVYASALSVDDITALADVVGPTGRSENAVPEFRWPDVPNAVTYELVVHHLDAPGNPVLSIATARTGYTHSAALGIGRYTAWVRATLLDATQSPWVSGSFEIATRVTTVPLAVQQTTPRPTLQWQPLAGAARYDLWIENRTNGQAQFVRDQQVTATSWTPTADMPLGQYRAWVRGVDVAGFPANWSPTVEFTVGPAPTPTAPLNSTFSQQPTFTWSTVSGAERYQLLIRNQRTGVNTYYEQNVTGTSWTPPVNLGNDTYRWWVRGVGATGITGNWSATTEISIGGRTTVLSPVGAGSNTLPAFSWRAVDGAVRYELWVDRVGVQAGYLQETSLTATSYVPGTPLPTGNYRVWVRAVSSTSQYSLWSPLVQFSIVAEAAPAGTRLPESALLTSLLPSDAAVTASLTAWSPPEDPAQPAATIPAAAAPAESRRPAQTGVPGIATVTGPLAGGHAATVPLSESLSEERLLDEVLQRLAAGEMI